MQLGSSLRRRRRSAGTGDDAARRALARLAGAGVLVSVLGLALGWLFATRVLFPAPAPPGDLYEVPDVRGETVESAGDLLREAGLALGGVGGLRHPEADSGRVVGQAPLPGQLATPSTPVRVTVSLGPDRRAVPEVTRLRSDWARNVLEATGFKVLVDSVESELPRGRVLGVDPEEGTELALPGEVRMEVSLGPPRFEMPSLLGMSEEEARDTLSTLGLVVGRVEEVFRFGRDQGRVVEQAPPPGAMVQGGAAVRISVGRRSGGRRSGGEAQRGGAGAAPPAGNKEPPEP